MNGVIDCDGIVFIGDPHLTSVRVGRRLEKDIQEVQLKKIDFCIDYCNENNMQAVFLGDMFDNAYEPDDKLKTRLIRALKRLKFTALSNIGNHCKSNAKLTDNDSLSILEAAGVVILAHTSGCLARLRINGKLFGLGATPYGEEFPLDATQYFPDTESVIWITHHDIAFENAYPGALAPRRIKGCNLVINGHMHLKKPMKKVGETIWVNNGNIFRQAVDAIEHKPVITVLNKEWKLKTVPIPHEREVFNLQGNLIASISPGEVAQDIVEESIFINMLKKEDALEIEKTEDASIIYETIVKKFEELSTPNPIQNIILNIHARAKNMQQSKR